MTEWCNPNSYTAALVVIQKNTQNMYTVYDFFKCVNMTVSYFLFFNVMNVVDRNS